MDKVCRNSLNVSLAALLLEVGFEQCDKMAQETLAEMLQALISQIGISAHKFCEQACRTQPVVGDVIVALVEMGVCLKDIEHFAKMNERTILSPLFKASHPKKVNNLCVGQRPLHPTHIPECLPEFPDPHTFLRTPTHWRPETEYEVIREKSSFQQKCVENALIKFVAKTSNAQSYFCNSDTNLFPLIPCQMQNSTYFKALLTIDQKLEFQDHFYLTPHNQSYHSPNKKLCKYSDNENNELEAGSELAENPYLRPEIGRAHV